MTFLKDWYKRISNNPVIHFVTDLMGRFGKNNGTFYAAGLAFFLLLSFAPILLSGVAVLGYFIDVHSASVKVADIIQNLLPAGGARDEAGKFLTEHLHLDQQVESVVRHRGVAGLLGLFSLLWATTQIFINASVAMNAMWDVSETRNWFLIRGIAIVLMFTTGTLTAASLLLSSTPTAIADYQLPIIHVLPISLGMLTVAFEFIAIIVNCLMYMMIYKVLPNSKVSWMAAAIGGVSASILFEVAKKWIATYFLRANTSIYGDLANLILFVLWIYYSMTILLLGAEISAAVTRLREQRTGIPNVQSREKVKRSR